MSVNFSSTGFDLACQIADRAIAIRAENGIHTDTQGRMGLIMDILAADGENGNPPLMLRRLLDANPADFAHDVFGIERHMDRTTGKIGDCFVARFAVQ